ncbi:SusD/RagB family nutrient-binding outer membrane lipoprotein [Rhodocytophaga rosea]|uniref:SusD/RagB family nutrient-binding outer membrane lipoprotein n=1 Tax=Rhodocytophaga rosea TaxID=2704465 RepID=A0A6C0GDW5_9BACT|nr:SusD/RagB family nutrient-binding outer membrane lipoprotein [Rhodocytophaga rosea]QHT65983.1 SusD/RagB family nutrient-binding outer membrane lipoprotein [Rhodocytophaga rosea]
MKRLYIGTKIFLLSMCLLVATSCDKEFMAPFRDDPNNPLDVSNDLQLSGLLGNFSYSVLGSDPARIPSFWIQYTAFTGAPPSEDNYDVDESDVDNLWTYSSYTAVMQNAKLLNESATRQENYHYAAIAKLIWAWNMSVVTDLWGEVPYSEAWQPEKTLKPKYDPQESIYTAVQELLDGAIEDFNKTSVRSPAADDLLYPAANQNAWRNNSLPKWIKMAYTLKARFHMHLTNAPGYDPVEQSNLALIALQNGFASNADNALFQYYDAEGAENPWFQWAIDGKWNDDTRLSASYVARLQGLNDPRLPIQVQPTTNGTPQYNGAPNGVGNLDNNDISNIGNFYSDAEAPLQWLTYAEAKFIEAEARFRVSGAEAAQEAYQQAIVASMEDLGVDQEAANNYVEARPVLTATNALEEIIEQKYIALFLQFEAFNDFRRTGFPNDLQLAADALTPTIPVRFPYPQQELLNNAENVSQTNVPTGRNGLTLPVWWDRD